MLADQAEFRRGVFLFNAGEWWEAHEAWEGLWRTAQGQERQFLQALILLAAALHKRWHHANLKHRNFAKAAAYLNQLPACYSGVDLATLRAAVWEALQVEGIRPQISLASR